MTEEQGKTKNCPLFSAVGLIVVTQLPKGGADIVDQGRKCEGAACAWGADANGAWRGQCGLVPSPPSIGPVIVNTTPPNFSDLAPPPIGKGVYNNPQPGNLSDGEKAVASSGVRTDIGSGG